MVQMDIYQKLILNILMNYMIYIIITHYLQKTLKLLIIFCQIIVAILQIKFVVLINQFQIQFQISSKLTKVYRVLKFKQSDWLKKYIDFNTDKGKHATNCFEKYFFKLMNNIVYGKTMENLRKRIKVSLVNNSKDYKEYVNRPSFVSQKIFSKNICWY